MKIKTFKNERTGIRISIAVDAENLHTKLSDWLIEDHEEIVDDIEMGWEPEDDIDISDDQIIFWGDNGFFALELEEEPKLIK